MTVMEITVNVETLKSNTQEDYMLTYLDEYKKVCQQRRDAYNIHSAKLKHRHNFITIPLLVVTSGTSVLAALQLDRIIVTSLGAGAAILTAVQRFCAYAERAENSSMTSKGYSRMVNKIETLKMYIRSNATTVQPEYYTKCIREIQQDIDSITEQAIDVPYSLLHLVTTVDACVCFGKVLGTQSTPPKIPELFA